MQHLHACFARFGALQPQPRDHWQGGIPLPEPVATFYQQIGPWGDIVHAQVGPVGIHVPGVDVCFPPLQRLWALQAGYRFDGRSSAPLPQWPARWLMIAEQHADPFIFDSDSGQVLFAFHGGGRWDATVLTADLATFIAAMAAIGTAYLAAGEDLHDDDDEIRPEHRQAARLALAEVLGDAEAADAFLDTLEW